jgi:integrase
MPAKGDGITKRKDGRYVGRYTTHTPDGPKRKTIYGKKYKEVERKLAEARGDAARGIVYDDQNLTVGAYMDRWLSDAVRGSVRESTYYRDECLVRVHMKPALGRVKLSNLNAMHLQSFYRGRLDSGLSGSTVQKIHHVLHKALSQAVRWNLIPRNPTDGVKAPTPSTKEMRPLSADEARLLLGAAKDNRLEALYVLALHTGMRRGELLGLKWDDVDLDAGVPQVRVRRTLTRTGGGKGLALGEPKTKASRRTVRLTPGAVEALKRYRARQVEERLKVGSLYADRGLVFAGESGGLINPLEPPPAVVHAAATGRRAASNHLPRPPAHVRVPPLLEERTSEVRPGTPRTRSGGDHPRHVLPHAPRHGRRSRRRYG